ncbi:MAG: sugar phosphate isomerase/epimerase family protein [Eubacteriales bacterium]|nr:sugar phosphate isomerase/epimerase family protein [Eubacteriales bacterium]
MTYAEGLKKGLSLSFFRELSEETMREAAAAGIDCAELSFSYDYYTNGIDFPKNAARYGKIARDAGLSVWSLHLPFSGMLDISNENPQLRSITLYTNKTLIRAAAEAGAQTIVLHPSSEPIEDDRRAERMRLSRDGICQLVEECRACGLTLAVENLPRTCLCRTSDEMADLLEGTGACAVFDTNHALTEDNIHFIDTLTARGIRIASLHISDYGPDAAGVLDERHRLPGDGINRWNELLAALERHGYTGPLMYEVSKKPRDREELPLAAVAANMRDLAAGRLA